MVKILRVDERVLVTSNQRRKTKPSQIARVKIAMMMMMMMMMKAGVETTATVAMIMCLPNDLEVTTIRRDAVVSFLSLSFALV
jgi:hypothetical protein